MNTTVRLKASEIYKDWHVIDAADRALGRVASEAATLLRGKHKPTFEPHLDMGDFVIVINASKVRVSGAKATQIKYYRHSGYPGGLKSRTYAEQMARFPDRVIEQAIWGMLPDGPLGKKMLKHLKVYAGPNHPHASQIAFTEKAQATRADATEALKTEARTAPRLRPLSIPQAIEVRSPDREGGPQPSPTKAPAPKAKGPGKAPRGARPATVVPELEGTTDAVLTSETPPPAPAAVNEDLVVAENATPAEAAIQQGAAIAEPAAGAPVKPKRARKPLADATSGDAGATPKPARARKAPPAEAEGEPATPKTTRARKPKAEADAPADGATEAKKPTRRRTPPRSEE